VGDHAFYPTISARFRGSWSRFAHGRTARFTGPHARPIRPCRSDRSLPSRRHAAKVARVLHVKQRSCATRTCEAPGHIGRVSAGPGTQRGMPLRETEPRGDRPVGRATDPMWRGGRAGATATRAPRHAGTKGPIAPFRDPSVYSTARSLRSPRDAAHGRATLRRPRFVRHDPDTRRGRGCRRRGP
jgi:hypothetical protein